MIFKLSSNPKHFYGLCSYNSTVLRICDSMNGLRSSAAEKEAAAMEAAKCIKASRTPGHHKDNSILGCSSKRTLSRSWQVVVSFCLAHVGLNT